MKRIVRTALCTAAALLLLLAAKNEYARLLPASTYGMQAVIRMEKIDHLFIGSSMFRQGLSIDVLEEKLNGSVYILSYNGNQPVFMERELEYMLGEGLEIENLYVDFYPYTAAALPWISDTKILLDTDISFKADAWRLMAAYNDTSFLDFYEMFVTANNEQLLTWPVNYRLVSAQFQNGGNILTPGGQTEEYLDSLETLGRRDGLQAAQVEGFREILRVAAERGITVYFIETPKYERMYRDEDYMELYRACLAALEEPSGSGIKSDTEILLSKELDFDNTCGAYFQDLIHLSAEGRTVYTELLCERLKSPGKNGIQEDWDSEKAGLY